MEDQDLEMKGVRFYEVGRPDALRFSWVVENYNKQRARNEFLEGEKKRLGTRVDLLETEITRYNATNAGLLEAELRTLREDKERLLMEKARKTASHAVLVQALAEASRDGKTEWSKRWLSKADAASIAVRREDLVVAHLNEARSSDGDAG